MNMGYKDCPCKGCKRRYTLCHSSCKEYKEWKAKIEAMKEKKIEEQKLKDALWEVTENSIKRIIGYNWKPKERTKK